MNLLQRLLCCFNCLLLSAAVAPAAEMAPRLHKQPTGTQLIVDDKPLIMLAGELHNSTASSLDYLETVWAKLATPGGGLYVTSNGDQPGGAGKV